MNPLNCTGNLQRRLSSLGIVHFNAFIHPVIPLDQYLSLLNQKGRRYYSGRICMALLMTAFYQIYRIINYPCRNCWVSMQTFYVKAISVFFNQLIKSNSILKHIKLRTSRNYSNERKSANHQTGSY